MRTHIGMNQVDDDGFVVWVKPLQEGQPFLETTGTLSRVAVTADLEARGLSAAEIDRMFDEAAGEYRPKQP